MVSSLMSNENAMSNLNIIVVCVCVCVCVCVHSVMSDSLQTQELKSTRLVCLWDFPGKNTGLGYHFLLQGIFPIQGSNPCLIISCIDRQILYHNTSWEAQI